jgi:outer membrane protein assembly factor BamB
MQKQVATLLAAVLASAPLSADWPQFRGPDGQGHSEATKLPLQWSETENVVWKTALPGQGYSSPVISGNQIWMTTATDGGKSLRAVCVDRASGQVVHNVEVLHSEELGSTHAQNGYASPTPVLDGRHVFVHFGARGTACLNTKGEIVWTNTEFDYALLQGAASSPILHGDLVILTCDGTDHQFLVALDKRTGNVRWKQPRQHLEAAAKKRAIAKMAYSTPLVTEIDGVAQLVSNGADHVAGYDAKTGKELWWKPYDGFSIVCRPSYGHGLFYVVGSIVLDHHALYAIRPGQGEIGEDRVVWQSSVSIPHVPSPLLVGNEIFVVHDGGVATCFDALTGKVHWKKRLGGNYRASPIEANKRIYIPCGDGKTVVFAASKEFKVLATNKLDGTLLASPAVAEDALFLRSETHLYRIEDSAGQSP